MYSFLKIMLTQDSSPSLCKSVKSKYKQQIQTCMRKQSKMAVGQNQWYHFGVAAPPILVYFSGDWDVYWGYGILGF